MNYALYANDGAARPRGQVFLANNEQDAVGTAALPLDAWTHLASTYDGATLRLYVNGTQVATRAISGALAATTGALRLGGNAIWAEYFAGQIDDVRLYERALSAAEIQNDMAAPAGG
jgi:Concanavalin A-like lectin/glucanases superfamily